MKTLITFSCVAIVMTFAASAYGQMCGQSFVKVLVFDTKNEPVTGSSFELLGKVPAEKFKELSAEYSQPNHSAVALPTNVGVELSKSKLEPLNTSDACGNPIEKQTDGTTKMREYRTGAPSTEHYGICMSEGSSLGPVLVRISAPGFETGYAITESFYGCGRRASFTLLKSGEK